MYKQQESGFGSVLNALERPISRVTDYGLINKLLSQKTISVVRAYNLVMSHRHLSNVIYQNLG